MATTPSENLFPNPYYETTLVEEMPRGLLHLGLGPGLGLYRGPDTRSLASSAERAKEESAQQRKKNKAREKKEKKEVGGLLLVGRPNLGSVFLFFVFFSFLF